MAETLCTFEVPLYYVRKSFQTTKTTFFRKGEDVRVTFTVIATIDLTKRFLTRMYRVQTITPDKQFPYLTRREAIALRNMFKDELSKQMYPYPVANFGVAMFEGMGAEAQEDE